MTISMTNHPAHALDAYRLIAKGETAFAEALEPAQL